MKDFTELNFRPAETGDALSLAKLIDIAGEGIPNWLWSHSAEAEQSALDVGVNRARRTTGGFSYTNARVAERFGDIVGMVLMYPIATMPDADVDELPQPIVPFVELEQLSVGTWYVNALAVLPHARGLGIGTALMADAEQAARCNGYDWLSIQVYEQNSGAVRLYERLGYSLAARSPVLSHPCAPYYTGDVLMLEKTLA
ncbi:GNAT family N-acetyltransferase [uncultured Tateyamaria sp.]|uniref:GNAT family N-acetyltransferase n=1 Tax=uncultured Tateyamaria sp. TaxID=455651 RepID=UPI002624392C|nr:GNAT family N-acetyltransferase [uncultured Tateyamaria sp.]